jgi:Flp pilus assembly protein TadG
MPRIESGQQGERGVVAVIVAMSLLALVLIAGGVIDVSRAVYAKQVMQAAADSAVLAASAQALNETTSSTPDPAKMTTVAANAFAANAPSNSSLVVIKPPGFVAEYRDDAEFDDSVVGKVSFEVPMIFAKLAGIDNIDFSIQSVAKRPRPSPVELVIVADVTESMNESFGATTKIAALKSAASNLVETLMAGDYVKVGLVPIAGLARLETPSNYHNPTTMMSTVPWLEMAPDPKIQDCVVKGPCEIKNYTCYKDGKPYICPTNVCTCLKFATRAYCWDGCVYIRPVPKRTAISNPSGTKYYALVSSAACSVGAQVMTDLVASQKDKVTGKNPGEEKLKARINSLKVIAGGWGTYIPVGLIWGWNMLTTETTPSGTIDNNYPLNSGYTPDEVKKLGVRKALVLISDGNNTLFANPVLVNKENLFDTIGNIYNPAHTAKQKENFLKQTNDEMVQICSNIRTAGIDVYIIALQFTVEDLAYKTILREQCASGTASTKDDYFFDVSDPKALNDAFRKIGKSYSYNSIVK